jgi:hypothetical protein
MTPTNAGVDMSNNQSEILEIIELQINSAIENDAPVHIKSTAAFLGRMFPRSGMSEDDFSRLVARIGIRRRVMLEFG